MCLHLRAVHYFCHPPSSSDSVVYSRFQPYSFLIPGSIPNFCNFRMSIAILNDPQLSNDVYDLLISQTAPCLVPKERPQYHDFVTIDSCPIREHQPSSMPSSLALLLRL
ncbi:hypothetical protein Y032_0263g595 [Ancylostoma ceylanicum]|uniref:Uncharacterized protein n=1 Tax=Ancylostoma ceylanicum TaxID=53326 RepID=A0A016S9Q4_9BILA|nr:hypothetical protein Y032_0263g595 [Ancylostoma ceylanicum]